MYPVYVPGLLIELGRVSQSLEYIHAPLGACNNFALMTISSCCRCRAGTKSPLRGDLELCTWAPSNGHGKPCGERRSAKLLVPTRFLVNFVDFEQRQSKTPD